MTAPAPVQLSLHLGEHDRRPDSPSCRRAARSRDRRVRRPPRRLRVSFDDLAFSQCDSDHPGQLRLPLELSRIDDHNIDRDRQVPELTQNANRYRRAAE
jgi:hypothetical protein